MKQLILSIAAISLLSAHVVLANKEVGTGGDICEDRFKIVRDDIASWINQGGSDGLMLPKGVAVAQYNAKMLAAISTAKISCIDAEVTVDQFEKTCKNFRDSRGTPQVVCNQKRFAETSESDQYVLVHHEYAGLSGLEISQGADSNYALSNQISEFLVEEVVRKLAVKPNPVALTPGKTPFETLKSAFDAAGPARVSDVPNLADMLKTNPPFACASADPHSPLSNDFVLGRIDVVTPPNGPLFPGSTTPAVSPMENIPEVGQSLYFAQMFSQNGQKIETTIDSSDDLRSEYTSPSNVVLDFVYRKSGNLLLVHGTGSINYDGAGNFQIDHVEKYGYCFPVASIADVPGAFTF